VGDQNVSKPFAVGQPTRPTQLRHRATIDAGEARLGERMSDARFLYSGPSTSTTENIAKRINRLSGGMD